jgi:hypothetical protein
MRPFRRRTTLASDGRLAAFAVASVFALPLTGCGEPDYCSDRSNIEQSVKGLTDVQLTESGGADRLKSQLEKVQSDAKQVASSSKSDFPSETDQLESSVSTLEKSVQGLPPSPSSEELKGLAPQVTAVAGASRRFVNATNSECS